MTQRASPAKFGGEVVLKSQVLSGGRMKAGGVQFASTPDEARDARGADILKLEIGGQLPRWRARRVEVRR